MLLNFIHVIRNVVNFFFDILTLHPPTHYLNEVTFLSDIFFRSLLFSWLFFFRYYFIIVDFRMLKKKSISSRLHCTNRLEIQIFLWLPWFILLFPDIPFYTPILASLHDHHVTVLPEPNRRRRYSQPSPFSPQKDLQYHFSSSQNETRTKSTSSHEIRCVHCDFRCTWKYDLKTHLKKKHGVIVKN